MFIRYVTPNFLVYMMGNGSDSFKLKSFSKNFRQQAITVDKDKAKITKMSDSLGIKLSVRDQQSPDPKVKKKVNDMVERSCSNLKLFRAPFFFCCMLIFFLFFPHSSL